MQFKQKKFSNEIHFDFSDNFLHYYSKDKSGSEKFSVKYLQISFDSIRELVERNSWYKMAGIFWIFLGVIQMAYSLKEGLAFRIPFWLIVGCFTYLIYFINVVKYTMLRSENGDIYIINDNKHDEIFNEIKNRRRSALRSLYGAVDSCNEPETELEKFDWLLREDAITHEEYAAAKVAILSRKKG